jgi:hypothetical protein
LRKLHINSIDPLDKKAKTALTPRATNIEITMLEPAFSITAFSLSLMKSGLANILLYSGKYSVFEELFLFNNV